MCTYDYRFSHCATNGKPARCVYSRAVGNDSDDNTAVNMSNAVEVSLTFVAFKVLQLKGETPIFQPVDWTDDGCSDGGKVTRSYGQPACLVHDFGYRNWFRIFPELSGKYDEANCKKGSCAKAQIDDNFGRQWNQLCRDDDHWAYVCNSREKVIVRGVNGLGDLGKEPKR
jgi:Prokaryotic phospholipase A2